MTAAAQATKLRALFPEDDDLRFTLRCFAIRCVSHRLRKFGFERHVNHYDSRELRILASMMPPFQADAILAEAALKESNHE